MIGTITKDDIMNKLGEYVELEDKKELDKLLFYIYSKSWIKLNILKTHYYIRYYIIMENLFTQREITQLLVVEDEYKTLTHNESINKLNSIAKLNKWSQRVALDKAIGEWEWCNDNKTVIKLIKSLLYINEFKTEGLKEI